MRRVQVSVGGRKVSTGVAADTYTRDDLGLSFYSAAPAGEESIRDFEECVMNRLKILHAFDRACGYQVPLANVSELPGLMTELQDARLALAPPFASNADSFEERKAMFCRRDALSHFILRVAFCKTHEARDWFVRQEQRLFAFRFDKLHPDAKEAFIMKAGVHCKKYDPDGKKISLKELQQTTSGAKIWRDDKPVYDNIYYEMPFAEVHPSLISGRKVVLQGGCAYVPSSALKIVLAGRFKDQIQGSWDQALRGLPSVLADPQVGDFMRGLVEQGMLLVPTKPISNEVGERLSSNNFEELLVRSFPPCMRRMVEAQREKKKHLKHQGRLFLRPFLKECGFTFDESVIWWRQELCRDSEIDAVVYDKNYKYDVDHAYGHKGHLQGQNSFACPKIINSPQESVGQVHGCMFKCLEMPLLKQQLHKWRVSESSVMEIEKLMKGNQYQLSCVEYFRFMHPGDEGDGVGNSPDHFYAESCRYHKKILEKASAGKE